ncbi:SDR family NAD(P)-dependent oxidoreductase [Modestobacter sp. VKM Ac-2978]|nr:SDR family NAD(P)-dependent oxidoreductase [Modestobacter sp. VKM Ac-2978]MCZ2849849.1 SDR family NAD(P)-dependent oxidoreductase [Modestobacter sp. VKM Ac-2978]
MTVPGDLRRTQVVVIGGTWGIGRRVAELAAAAGDEVLISGRDGAKLRTVVGELCSAGIPVTGSVVDARDDDGLARFFAGVGRFAIRSCRRQV